jgi:hypothetical protein
MRASVAAEEEAEGEAEDEDGAEKLVVGGV